MTFAVTGPVQRLFASKSMGVVEIQIVAGDGGESLAVRSVVAFPDGTDPAVQRELVLKEAGRAWDAMAAALEERA